MSTKNDRIIRKEMNKYKKDVQDEKEKIIHEWLFKVLNLPLKGRLKIALSIIKGNKKVKA